MRMKYFYCILILTIFSAQAHYEEVYISNLVYYDSNADGFIDSISMYHTGPVTNADSTHFLSNIVFPEKRNFKLRGNKIYFPAKDVIAISVTEENEEPSTAVANNERFRFTQITMPGGGELKSNNPLPIDSVAPVLLSAELISYGSIIDSFRMVFSEPVLPFTYNRPFRFRNASGNQYLLTFSSFTVDGNLFTGISNGGNLVNDGDSVWINVNALISDLNGNIQDNPRNRRVVLKRREIENVITFHDAAYFDVNADGFIDRIVFNTSGIITDGDIDEILNAVTLPPNRNFVVESLDIQQNQLIFIVNEGSNLPNTGVTTADRIEVTQTILSGQALLQRANIMISDSVAPVIVWAHLDAHDIGEDTIIIRFSESVTSINSQTPFRFQRPGRGQYTVTLSTITLDNTGYFRGRVLEVSEDSVRIGDSVWINTDASISDVVGNRQLNPNNRRVQITLDMSDFPIILTEAAYFDLNADGLIDRIKIRYNGPLHDDDLTTLLGLIRFPSTRNFSNNKTISLLDSVITIAVNEFDRNPRTYILPGDRLEVAGGRMPEDGIVIGGSLQIQDSISPVIVRAHLDWYSDDEQRLSVVFSEPVQPFSDSLPFLYRRIMQQYNVIMERQNRVFGNNYIGEVQRDPMGMQQGDSVWINNDARITDFSGNTQRAYLSRKTVLTVKYHFQMRVLAENNPYIKDKRPMPAPVARAYASNNVQIPEDGLIIIVDPDRELANEYPLKGTVSIYDAIQNQVIQNKPMVYDSETNRLYYVWNTRNYNGREVGTGTYLAVVRIKGTDQKFTKRINIGVKR